MGVIGSQIERQQDDNQALAYWLTNTVTLLHLLQKNIKPASGNSAVGKRPAGASTRGVFGTLFGTRNPNAPPAHNEASIHGGAAGERGSTGAPRGSEGPWGRRGGARVQSFRDASITAGSATDRPTSCMPLTREVVRGPPDRFSTR